MILLETAVSSGERGLGWPILCPVGSSSAELAVEEEKRMSMLQGMSTLADADHLGGHFLILGTESQNLPWSSLEVAQTEVKELYSLL